MRPSTALLLCLAGVVSLTACTDGDRPRAADRSLAASGSLSASASASPVCPPAASDTAERILSQANPSVSGLQWAEGPVGLPDGEGHVAIGGVLATAGTAGVFEEGFGSWTLDAAGRITSRTGQAPLLTTWPLEGDGEGTDVDRALALCFDIAAG